MEINMRFSSRLSCDWPTHPKRAIGHATGLWLTKASIRFVCQMLGVSGRPILTAGNSGYILWSPNGAFLLQTNYKVCSHGWIISGARIQHFNTFIYQIELKIKHVAVAANAQQPTHLLLYVHCRGHIEAKTFLAASERHSHFHNAIGK